MAVRTFRKAVEGQKAKLTIRLSCPATTLGEPGVGDGRHSKLSSPAAAVGVPAAGLLNVMTDRRLLRVAPGHGTRRDQQADREQGRTQREPGSGGDQSRRCGP